MTRVGTLLIVVPLLSTLVACDGGESSSSSPPPANEPALGSPAWGTDNCLYNYVGGQRYAPANLCRYTESPGTTAYRRPNDPTVLYREQAGYTYLPNSSLNLPLRYPTGNSSQYEVLYNGQWISAGQYASIRAQQQVAAGQQEAAAREQAAEAQKAALLERLDEIRQQAIDRILAPACNSSYNGCG